MSQSLYPIILFMAGKDITVDLSVNWSEFSLSYSCVIIFGLLVIMTLPRDTSYIRKVNAFGVVFIIVFLTFVLANGFLATFTTDYTYSKEKYDQYIETTEASKKGTETEIDYMAYIPIVGPSFFPVMGILGGGFYFHNMALPIISNAQHPENNMRNIFIGFLLVFLTYSSVGVAGVYGFTGVDFASFVPSLNLIQENCLNQLPSDSVGSTVIRLCIFFQLLAVSTLLFGMIRVQIVLLYNGINHGVETGSRMPTMLSRKDNFILCFSLIIPLFVLGVWYPYVGQIGALLAAFATMTTIYIITLMVYLKAKYEEMKQEKSLKSNLETLLNPSNSRSSSEVGKIEEKQELGCFSFYKTAFLLSFVAAFGVGVFVIQLFYISGKNSPDTASELEAQV